MTRTSDDQLELAFDGEHESSKQGIMLARVQSSASIVCFGSYLQMRRIRDEEAKDAKLIEQIARRVQRFK